MAHLTSWTVEDLAMCIEACIALAIDDTIYCQHCAVVPVADGDKYCDACANEIAEALAERFTQQYRIEEGWY